MNNEFSRVGRFANDFRQLRSHELKKVVSYIAVN